MEHMRYIVRSIPSATQQLIKGNGQPSDFVRPDQIFSNDGSSVDRATKLTAPRPNRCCHGLFICIQNDFRKNEVI